MLSLQAAKGTRRPGAVSRDWLTAQTLQITDVAQLQISIYLAAWNNSNSSSFHGVSFGGWGEGVFFSPLPPVHML
jgi:hypothetical protein